MEILFLIALYLFFFRQLEDVLYRSTDEDSEDEIPRKKNERPRYPGVYIGRKKYFSTFLYRSRGYSYRYKRSRVDDSDCIIDFEVGPL